jgi:hypothetical protein
MRANALAALGLNGEPFDECLSSGIKSASAAIHANNALLRSLIVYTDGTNNATAIIYDNATEASGTELAKIVVKGSELMGGETAIKVRAENGLYLELSGVGATALVRYIDIV